MSLDVTLDFLTIKKNLKKDFSNFRTYKIALLGDSSTQFLHQAIRGYGYEEGLNLEIYEADYAQLEQEVNTPSAGLYTFQPDYVILFHSTQKILNKFYSHSNIDKVRFSDNHIKSLEQTLQTLWSQLNSKVIYFNFIEIDDGVFGNYANKMESSFLFQLRKLNYEIMNLALTQPNLFINDICSLNSREGLSISYDSKIYINADVTFSLDFTARVAKNIVDIMLPGVGRIKKCLILDLDNTLWGGIIGDDGMENIQLGELGIGKAFTQLQGWIKQLKQRGIILAVCSKNTEDIAKEPFEKHPDMVLRLEDISIFVANWENKIDNIKYIQSVLNIGFDSMVFLDDNPYERGLVKSAIPAIEVPELPEDPAEYLPYLRMLNLFETAAVSEEDTERTKLYQDEAKRVILKQSLHSEEDYLKNLEMICDVRSFDQFNTPRVAQLTQRSNQFNLRTIRYSEGDIARINASSEYRTLSFNLKDRFGEHGLIAAIILKKENESLFIDTWVMSCRVLKRGMEEFIINEIVRLAHAEGIERIIGQYIPTPKNGIVKDLYRSLNFSQEGDRWLLGTTDYRNHKTYINAIY